MESEKVGFCVSWSGQLEPHRLSAASTISDVAAKCASSLGAPPEHKQFIFKGQLLVGRIFSDTGLLIMCQDGTSSLRDASDCSVLHLVLNESMPSGRPLHVRDSSNRIFTLRCEADDYVEDVKDKLSTFPGVSPETDQGVGMTVFARSRRLKSCSWRLLEECFRFVTTPSDAFAQDVSPNTAIRVDLLSSELDG
eukprot:151665-Hanusia_phi.AAC.1